MSDHHKGTCSQKVITTFVCTFDVECTDFAQQSFGRPIGRFSQLVVFWEVGYFTGDVCDINYVKLILHFKLSGILMLHP
jgi:hypothetical protein